MDWQAWMPLFSILAALFAGGIFLLALISFLLSGVNKILDAKIKPIEEKLENHIASTGKKIDKIIHAINTLAEKQKVDSKALTEALKALKEKSIQHL